MYAAAASSIHFTRRTASIAAAAICFCESMGIEMGIAMFASTLVLRRQARSEVHFNFVQS